MMHAIVALGVTLLAGLLGGVFVVGFYLGWETDQAYQRVMRSRGVPRKEVPLGVIFTAEAWNKKSIIDLLAPILVVLLVILT